MKKRYIFGEWHKLNQTLTADDAQKIIRSGQKLSTQFNKYPMDKIFSFFAALSKVWSDKNLPARQKLLEKLPSVTGFSKEMIELGLDSIPILLNKEALEEKVKTELGFIPGIKDFFEPETGKRLTWQPLGVVLHVLAGNVFLGGLASLLEGLLSRNITILKMSSSEQIFLPEFLQTIKDIDKEGIISSSIALVDYSSSAQDVIQTFKKNMDGIVVWGGEQAVQGYRNNLPASCELIIFGPKLSLGIVTKDAINNHSIGELAEKLATDVAIWDQNACTAPQMVYVQNYENAEKLAHWLGEKLKHKAHTLPTGNVDINSAVEIRKMRTVAEVEAGIGKGNLFASEKDMSFTVILEQNNEIFPTPLHRTIRVTSFETIDEITDQMKKLSGYIQSVGLASSQASFYDLAKTLSEAGALRIINVGQMGGGPFNDPHDGAYDLRKLGHLIISRNIEDRKTPFEFSSQIDFKEKIDSRLRQLIFEARKSPYYQEALGNQEVQTTSDLKKLPILSKKIMEENMQNDRLATRRQVGGYVSRSGGSSGSPKYSIYDQTDWEEMISEAVNLFQAMGLRRGDRLANCFVAGNLYGGFISFDHINYRLGVTTFGLAGTIIDDVFIDIWKRFKINAIMGVPAKIIPALRIIKNKVPEFTLEKVIYAGSPLSKADYQWLKNTLKVKRIASVIGANDGGQMAYQCESMSGSLHHTIDEYNFVEIVDENLNPVADGIEGEIIITSLMKSCYPLIRYRIGDRGKIHKTNCPCGSHRRVLEYRGRADTMFSVGMMNIDFENLQSAVNEFSVTEMQVIIYSDNQGEGLKLNLEMESAKNNMPERILENIFKHVPYLKDKVENQLIHVPLINVLRPGEIKRNERTGKIQMIIDQRITKE